jgi:hypothetical protein
VRQAQSKTKRTENQSGGEGAVSGPYYNGSIGHRVARIAKVPMASFKSVVQRTPRNVPGQTNTSSHNVTMGPGIHHDLIDTNLANLTWGKYVAKNRWEETQEKNAAGKLLNQINAKEVFFGF